jgi:alpha-tubulin suppressor-like RCC1 family protein
MPKIVPLDWLCDRRRVVQLTLGDRFTLLTDDEGKLYAVGRNDKAQFGRRSSSTDADDRIPRPVAGIGEERIAHAATGSGHCAAVTEDGKLFVWGWNVFGQCGTGKGSTTERVELSSLGEGARVAFVACGAFHTVVVTSVGVIVFGHNHYGQLGTGNNNRQPTPTLLTCAALDGVRIVGCAAGNGFTHLVSDDGRVYAMGLNSRGQCGTGGTDDTNTPTEIDAAHFGGVPVVAVACGDGHVLMITAESKLYACGWGICGATGLGHTKDVVTPRPVAGALADAHVVRITAGAGHSCALTEDGRVFAFGRNGGVPAAGAKGIPQLLQDTLAGTTVCALGGGCCAGHSAFVTGSPPDAPGFELPLAFPWHRRRLLLMCLLFAKRQFDECAPAPAATTDVLLRLAALPEALLLGPCLFQFL